jgi:hypothetical protein
MVDPLPVLETIFAWLFIPFAVIAIPYLIFMAPVPDDPPTFGAQKKDDGIDGARKAD